MISRILVLLFIFTLIILPVSSVLIAGETKGHEDIILTPENTVNLRGVVTIESTTAWQFQILAANALRGELSYPIYLVLDSPGGDIYAGEQFIEFVKKIPNLKTISIFAASMASAIVEAVPGERLITNNGILMFHRAAGTFQGYFNDGEVESQLAMWKEIVSEMEKRNANRLDITLEVYRLHARNEWWLNGEQSVQLKAADRKIDIICSTDLVVQREESLIQTPLGNIALEFSRCPLIRLPLGEAKEK